MNGVQLLLVEKTRLAEVLNPNEARPDELRAAVVQNLAGLALRR